MLGWPFWFIEILAQGRIKSESGKFPANFAREYFWLETWILAFHLFSRIPAHNIPVPEYVRRARIRRESICIPANLAGIPPSSGIILFY